MYRFRWLLLAALCSTKAASAQTTPSPTTPPVYSYVEQMPVFPGGQEALLQVLGQTMVYPAEALQQKLEGRVFVGFVVNESGNVQNVKVSKGVHPLLDAEAVRAVQALPAFVAGKQNGRPVSVAYTLPITFRLPNAAAAPSPVAPLLSGPRPASQVGQEPYPQGKQEALDEYLKTVSYPVDAQQAQASGIIVVEVTVDAAGQVSKVSTNNGIGLQDGQITRIMPTLRLAAIKLLSEGPAWVPGQLKGKNISASAFVPLQFDAASGTVSIVPGLRLFPDEGPIVPNGPEQLLKYMSQNIRYPTEALRNQRQGKVVLFVQVSEEGRLEQPMIIEPVSPELDAEVLRVAAQLPPVFPALEQGKPVRSYFLLPFTFSIR